MSRTIKNYQFCNFDLTETSSKTEKNKLSVVKSNNIFSNKNVIMSNLNFINFSNFLINYYNFSNFSELNCEIINNAELFYFYSYFDENVYEINNRMFLIDENLNLYELDFDNNSLLEIDVSFDNIPEVFCVNNKLYFRDHNTLYFIEEGNSIVKITYDVYLDKYCESESITYFTLTTSQKNLYYTESDEIENLNNEIENYIEADLQFGKILDIVKLRGSVYVIQQYAISKIVTSSDEYYLRLICDINSKIIENTIGRYNDYFIFTTLSGIMIFDGNQTKNLFTDYPFAEFYNDLKGLTFNGKYYLCINNSGENSSKLAEFDLIESYYNVYKFNGKLDLYKISNQTNYHLLIKTTTENSSEILTLSSSNYKAKSEIIFNKLTFDEHQNKTIKSVKFDAKGEFVFKIQSDYSSATFNICGSEKIDNIGLLGNTFQISISSENFFEINLINFEVFYLE